MHPPGSISPKEACTCADTGRFAGALPAYRQVTAATSWEWPAASHQGSAAAGQPELAPTPADWDAAGADDDVDDGAGGLGGVVGVGTGVDVGAGLVGAGLVDPEPAGFGR